MATFPCAATNLAVLTTSSNVSPTLSSVEVEDPAVVGADTPVFSLPAYLVLSKDAFGHTQDLSGLGFPELRAFRTVVDLHSFRIHDYQRLPRIELLLELVPDEVYVALRFCHAEI